MSPVYLPTGNVIPGHFATVRSDNGSALGIVGSRYRVLQHRDGLSLFDGLANMGLVSHGRAGAFKKGAIVWIQAEIPGSIYLGEDEVKRFVLLATGHDGSMPLRLMSTPIRVVCKNTLMAAIRGAEDSVTIRHTASGEARLDQARKAMAVAERYYAQFGEAATHLYRTEFTFTKMRQFAEELMPNTADKEASGRLLSARRDVIDLFETGKGHFSIEGTAWAAYNAVTEYVDHRRATRGEESNRLQSALLGSGAQLKRKAWDLLLA